jgi:hypothetical protein
METQARDKGSMVTVWDMTNACMRAQPVKVHVDRVLIGGSGAGSVKGGLMRINGVSGPMTADEGVHLLSMGAHGCRDSICLLVCTCDRHMRGRTVRSCNFAAGTSSSTYAHVLAHAYVARRGRRKAYAGQCDYRVILTPVGVHAESRADCWHMLNVEHTVGTC